VEFSLQCGHDDSAVNYEGITMQKMTYVHELFRTMNEEIQELIEHSKAKVKVRIIQMVIKQSKPNIRIGCYKNEVHTANALSRKFEPNIPGNETVRPRSQFLHSCICERFTV
jgi:hypothetical protein